MRRFIDFHKHPALSEDERRGLIIDGDRFGLPLGFCSSSPAEARAPGKQAGNNEEAKLEDRPYDKKGDIK